MKTIPKSMQPPEVKGTSSGVEGFEDFEVWASRNIPIWHGARSCAAQFFLDRHEYLKLVAYHLTLENKQMKDALIKHSEETGKLLFPA